jgi:hypothetical protein
MHTYYLFAKAEGRYSSWQGEFMHISNAHEEKLEQKKGQSLGKLNLPWFLGQIRRLAHLP